jgi:adenosine deaminase
MNQLSFEQLHEMPKIELHRHLDCSMRFSTLIELAQSLGIDVPIGKSKQREKFLILNPMKDLESTLK